MPAFKSPVVLPADPSSSSQAANKNYVDAGDAANVAKSTLTTKGDLYVATGSGVVTRLGVGSDNQVLTADSSQTAGVKWGAAGAGTVTSVTAADGTITVAGTANDPTIAVGSIAESQVTGLVTDLSNKQPLDSDLTTIASLTATTDNFMVAASSAWASRTPAQAKASLAITESDVSGLVSDLAAKAPLASPTFTGTLTTPRIITPPVTLTDASTVTVDASLGNVFRLTLTATGHTMGNPSNSVDGQKILFEIISGGAFTFAWGTNYAWGTDVTLPTLSQTSTKVDYVGFVYNSTAGKWRGLAYARGY